MDAQMLALQTELERLFSKNQLFPRIRGEFLNAKETQGIDVQAYMVKHEIDPEFGLDLLVQMVLHKRTTPAVLIGILQRHFSTAQECADALYKAAEVDLVDFNQYGQFVVKYDITADVQADLDRYQFPLPMVVPPRHIKSNTDSGYLLNNSSVILRDNHHYDDVCLDHLNRMNAVRFTINNKTASMVKNSWRNLDKPKEGESKEDFKKRVKAFEKYDRTVHDVIAKLTEHGNEFYLTHKYDKRGRSYCQGYHVSYQGAPWNKAVIELADKEYIG